MAPIMRSTGTLRHVVVALLAMRLYNLLMKLTTWLKRGGRGAAAALVRAASTSFETVRAASSGRLVRRAVAERISAATGGAVPAKSMMTPRHQNGPEGSPAS